MSPFGLKFSQMILHKLMYNWSFLFVVLQKPTLLPSTVKEHEAPTAILYLMNEVYSEGSDLMGGVQGQRSQKLWQCRIFKGFNKVFLP